MTTAPAAKKPAATGPVGPQGLAAAPTPLGTILGNAQSWVNAKVPYLTGGASKLAADCSGYINAMWLSAGYSLNGFTGAGHGPTTYQLALDGRGVPLAGAGGLANATPGEILLFNEPGDPLGHAAIYAGNGLDYEESTPGSVAHLIPVDTAHLAAVRQLIDAAGRPTGPGVTGTFNGTAPAAVGYSSGAAPTTAPAPTASPTTALFNRSMLVRVGIGVMAVAVLLIGLDQLAKPGSSPSTVLTEGAANTAGRVSSAGAWGATTVAAAGPPIARHTAPQHHSSAGGNARFAAVAKANRAQAANFERAKNQERSTHAPDTRPDSPAAGRAHSAVTEDFG